MFYSELLQIAPETNCADDCYTFKNYYFPLSDDEDVMNKKKQSIKKRRNIEVFFEKPKKKRTSIISSCVGQASENGMSYISANDGDSCSATHLMKVEIYDMKNLKDVSPQDYWKYAETRVKYYVKSEDDKQYLSACDLVYNITKQIAGVKDCKKYFIEKGYKQ